jgi:hypothetical protein
VPGTDSSKSFIKVRGLVPVPLPSIAETRRMIDLLALSTLVSELMAIVVDRCTQAWPAAKAYIFVE